MLELPLLLQLIEVACFAIFTIFYVVFVIRWLFLNKKKQNNEVEQVDLIDDLKKED